MPKCGRRACAVLSMVILSLVLTVTAVLGWLFVAGQPWALDEQDTCIRVRILLLNNSSTSSGTEILPLHQRLECRRFAPWSESSLYRPGTRFILNGLYVFHCCSKSNSIIALISGLNALQVRGNYSSAPGCEIYGLNSSGKIYNSSVTDKDSTYSARISAERAGQLHPVNSTGPCVMDIPYTPFNISDMGGLVGRWPTNTDLIVPAEAAQRKREAFTGVFGAAAVLTLILSCAFCYLNPWDRCHKRETAPGPAPAAAAAPESLFKDEDMKPPPSKPTVKPKHWHSSPRLFKAAVPV